MITVEALDPYKILYNLPPKTDLVIAIGGRGGAKTYEVSKFGTFSATIYKKRVGILRDEKEVIGESILSEIFQRYDTANEYGHLDQHYDKLLGKGIRDKESGKMLIFTKGFRASSKDKSANLKGLSGIDIAIVEEAEDIRDKRKFNTFRDSVRTKNRLIIVILNTPDINHWIVKTYFHLDPVLDDTGQATGYYKLIPKKIPGFVCIQTSYQDNPYLPEDVVRDYESYGDPQSHNYDPHYYNTAILGYASSGRQGQILTKVKRISLKDYLALPYKEVYGIDFGTASPAGLIGVKMHRNTVWARELNYKGLDTLGIAKLLSDMKITPSDIIVADSAEPLSIQKLISGWSETELDADTLQKYPGLKSGFYVLPALKPPGSVESGIKILKSKDLYVVEESVNFWEEINNYIWKVDRNHNPTDEPVDEFNHLIDPLRYVVTGHGRIF